MAQVNFGNCYDAFRHVQSMQGTNVTLGETSGSAPQISRAVPDAAMTDRIRSTFVDAVKTELSGDTRFVNAEREAERARSARIADTVKSVFKYIGLTILSLTGIGGIGLLIYALAKKSEHEIRDVVQQNAIAGAFEVPDDVDYDPEGGGDGHVPGNAHELGEYDILNEQQEHLINDLTSRNGPMNKDEISRMMDLVESFKAKRTLLKETRFNAFNPNAEERKTVYTNIRNVCKLLFRRHDNNFKTAIWNAVRGEASKFKPDQLERFKTLFKESICDRMTTILMQDSEVTGALDFQEEWGPEHSLHLESDLANKFGNALNVVLHDMFLAELDSHVDR